MGGLNENKVATLATPSEDSGDQLCRRSRVREPLPADAIWPANSWGPRSPWTAPQRSPQPHTGLAGCGEAPRPNSLTFLLGSGDCWSASCPHTVSALYPSSLRSAWAWALGESAMARCVARN